MADTIVLHDHTPSDLFLVRRAKTGDSQAAKRLLERYEGFIRFKAALYNLPGGDWHDLLQEGRVGLLKAIRDYRLDRNSSFRNFADLCVSRQIITALKTATRGKHQTLNTARRFTAFAGSSDNEAVYDPSEKWLMAPTFDQPEEILMRRERLLKLCMLEFNLTKLEAWSVAMLVAGYSYADTAAELRIDEKSVDNALQRARRKLKPIQRLAA